METTDLKEAMKTIPEEQVFRVGDKIGSKEKDGIVEIMGIYHVTFDTAPDYTDLQHVLEDKKSLDCVVSPFETFEAIYDSPIRFIMIVRNDQDALMMTTFSKNHFKKI